MVIENTDVKKKEQKFFMEVLLEDMLKDQKLGIKTAYLITGTSSKKEAEDFIENFNKEILKNSPLEGNVELLIINILKEWMNETATRGNPPIDIFKVKAS